MIDVIERRDETCGDYQTEKESAAAFDEAIATCPRGTWSAVHREVSGYYIAFRPGREQKTARIDRLLVPGPILVERGWPRVIGVELKRSGEKLGPVIAQAIDYTWAIYSKGINYLYPEWVFIWPCERQKHSLESIMAQNRIGNVCQSKYSLLSFQIGAGNAITISRDGEVTARDINSTGKGTGSR